LDREDELGGQKRTDGRVANVTEVKLYASQLRIKLFRQPGFWDELIKVVSDAAILYPSVDPDKVQPNFSDINSWKEDSRAYQGDKIKLIAYSSASAIGENEYRWKYAIADKKGAKITEQSLPPQKENYIIIASNKTVKGTSIKAECVLFDTQNNSSVDRVETSFPIDDSPPCQSFFSTLISVGKDALTYYKDAMGKETYKEHWEKSQYANPIKTTKLRSGDIIMRTGGKLSEVMRRIATPWAEVTHSGLVEVQDGIHFVHQVVASGYEVVPLSRDDSDKIKELKKGSMLRMRDDSSKDKLPDKLNQETTFLDEALVGSVILYRMVSVQRPDGSGWKPDPLSPIDWDLENIYGDAVIKHAKKLGSKVKFYDWLAVESSRVGQEQETISQLYYCNEFVRDCIAKVFPGYDPKPRQSEALKKIWQSIFECEKGAAALAQKHDEWLNLLDEMINNVDSEKAIPDKVKKAVIELMELVLKGGLTIYLKEQISEGVRNKVKSSKVLGFFSLLIPDHMKTFDLEIQTKRISLKGIKTVEEELYVEFIDDLSSTLGTDDLVPLSVINDKLQMRWRKVVQA
jgi:hypothetical protein